MGFMADNREIAPKRFQTCGNGGRFCLGFEVKNLGNFCGGGDSDGEQSSGLAGSGERTVPEFGGREGGIGLKKAGELFDLGASLGAEGAIRVDFLGEGVSVTNQVELHR
jgi:hypothetical protein